MNSIVEFCLHELKNAEEIELVFANPDLHFGKFDGERLVYQGVSYFYRSLSTWVNLAESLGCRMTCPEMMDDFWFKAKLVKLAIKNNWHDSAKGGNEKYGAESPYRLVDKRQDPFWCRDYRQCLELCQFKSNDSLLSLGVNRGDELSVLSSWFPHIVPKMKVLGLDHCESAISEARQRFNSLSYRFENFDITQTWPETEKFDHLISIATLQSGQFDGYAIFRKWFQNHLKLDACVILGFPNCRYVDGDMIYGAKTKNFKNPEMSLLLKDLNYYKKYLQSHKKRVVVFGKYTIFLTAVPV